MMDFYGTYVECRELRQATAKDALLENETETPRRAWIALAFTFYDKAKSNWWVIEQLSYTKIHARLS